MSTFDTTGVSTIQFNAATHRFETADLPKALATAETIDRPISVILQVTRRCNYDCVFCSETLQMPDPTLAQLETIRRNLEGVTRIYVSGGEPLVRSDLCEILDMFAGAIVALPTNATFLPRITPDLVQRLAYVNIGLDGPRSVTGRVRGDYDRILEGVSRFKDLGTPFSLSAVVLRSTQDSVPFTAQIADVLGARKLKLILPIRKGNGLTLPDEEYLDVHEAETLFHRVREYGRQFDWSPKLTLTAWTPEVEGYSILVYPNGETYAWPVYDAPDKVLRLGSLLEEPIDVLWKRYPFKLNHLRKYLGASIFVS